MALPNSLEKLLDDGVIDDVKGRLLSGKEASVFVVERKGELIAAKVYKPREQRSFKATSSYTEGRNQTRNSRDKRAMDKRTSYGRELLEESWRDMEFRALSEAFHAGVRVPEPILLYEDVLLMELLVDETGEPAPRLSDFELPADVAALLHREIYGQVRLLLGAGKVHGDLSAFNILITYKGATLIDLPQVVDAAGNSQAADILRRDLRNVTEHLARFDPSLARLKDCGEALWHHYQRGTLDRAVDPEPGRSSGPREPQQGGPRQGGPRQGGYRGDGPRQGGPREGPRQGGPREGPRQGGPREGPRQGGPRGEGPRRDGPKRDGPRRERHEPEIVRTERPRPDGLRPEGGRPRQDGPRHEGPHKGGPRHDGERPRGPGGPRGPRPGGGGGGRRRRERVE